MEIRERAKPAIVASSGTAIITDNISPVKSRCNWLVETMNSNPRLVTRLPHNNVSNPSIARRFAADYYIYLKILFYTLSRWLNALIAFTFVLVALLALFEPFCRISVRGSSAAQFVRFVLRPVV